jgi:hypothetical protein
MELWEKEIRKFDTQLKKRMMVIWKYEKTGFNIDKGIFIKSLLGFPDRSRPPAWRDANKEWRFRNSEWENQKERDRYLERKRLTGFGRKREYSELKVFQDRYRERYREEINLRARLRVLKREGEANGESERPTGTPP